MSRVVRCDECGKELDRLPGEAEMIPPYWNRVILTWSDTERWIDVCSADCLLLFSKKQAKLTRSAL